MTFQVRKNGQVLGVFGTENLRNLNLAVASSDDKAWFFASGVYSEDGRNFFYEWPSVELDPQDLIEISRTTAEEPSEPSRVRAMDRPRDVDEKVTVCDFCYKTSSEVGRIVEVGEDRPKICIECVELCGRIYEKLA